MQRIVPYTGQRLLLTEDKLQQLLQLPGWEFPDRKVPVWATMFATLKRWCADSAVLPPKDLHVRTESCWVPLGKWHALQLEGGSACTKRQADLFQQWRQSATTPV